MDRRDFIKKATTFIFAGGLFLPSRDIIRPAEALNMAGFGSSGVAGCSYPTKDSFTTDPAQTTWLGYSDGTKYASSKFTAGSSYSLAKLTVKLLKAGSPSFTITAYIYSTPTNDPVNLLATSTDTLSAASVSTSATDYTFNFSNYGLISGTSYSWALGCSSVGDSSNRIDIYGGSGGRTCLSADGSTWTYDSTLQCYFITQSCS